MRSVRVRILATLLVLAVVGVGGWQLLPSKGTGRTITVGTTDEVTSLDPAGAYDAGSWALFSNVFQSLLTFEPGGATPVPDAAESCAFEGRELRTYRCALRDGLTFPSGREMTAKDVKYSFDRVKKINSDVGPASLLCTLAVGRRQRPDGHLPAVLARRDLPVQGGHGSRCHRRQHQVPRQLAAHRQRRRRHRAVRTDGVHEGQEGGPRAQRRLQGRGQEHRPPRRTRLLRRLERAEQRLEGEADRRRLPPAAARCPRRAEPERPRPARLGGRQLRDPQPRPQRPRGQAPARPPRCVRPSPG